MLLVAMMDPDSPAARTADVTGLGAELPLAGSGSRCPSPCCPKGRAGCCASHVVSAGLVRSAATPWCICAVHNGHVPSDFLQGRRPAPRCGPLPQGDAAPPAPRRAGRRVLVSATSRSPCSPSSRQSAYCLG